MAGRTCHDPVLHQPQPRPPTRFDEVEAMVNFMARVLDPNAPVTTHETVLLRREIEMLREERERERQEAQTTIADLRRRLDTEAEERRKLTAVLSDLRAAPPAMPPQAAKRSWWGWWRS